MEAPPTVVLPAPSAGVLVRIGQFFFKFRDFLSPVVFVALVLATPPHWLKGDQRYDIALDAVGIALILAGQILRGAVIGFAYIRRGGKNKQVYADKLVTGGFFAHSRNPLYVGNYLTFMGLFVVHNSLWCYVIGIAFYTFMYWTIVLAEEDFLRREFGSEYIEYCQRVNRFLPSFKGLSASLEDMSYDWQRLIRKEYGTTFSCLSCLLGLLIWQRYRNAGFAESKAVIAVVGGVWLLSLIGYLLARYWKKQGWLGRG